MNMKQPYTRIGTDGSAMMERHPTSADTVRGLAALQNLLDTVRAKIVQLNALPPDRKLSSMFVMDLEALRRDEFQLLLCLTEAKKIARQRGIDQRPA